VAEGGATVNQVPGAVPGHPCTLIGLLTVRVNCTPLFPTRVHPTCTAPPSPSRAGTTPLQLDNAIAPTCSASSKCRSPWSKPGGVVAPCKEQMYQCRDG
jgi:hypothetical protein